MILYADLEWKFYYGPRCLYLGRERGWGLLPYIDYTGMCRCSGYGFQTIESRNVWVYKSRKFLSRTRYQNQAISNLEQGQVCEGPAAQPHSKL